MMESVMDASSPRSYDASNRIAAAARVAYDAAGDMIRDGKHSYQFDAERRISQVDGGAADYLYSAEGDRIEKRVGGEATETIWVGNDPIAEMRPDGTWVDYLYLDGRRVAAIGKADATYYVADPLGMTRMELSATGDILTQSDMTPFGQLINRRSDADEVPFTGGEQYDAESGLYSYKYRSYNPQLGRWMSPDPSDEEFARVSNPQSLNLYSYVINDPLKYVDRLGLASCIPCQQTQQKEAVDQAQAKSNIAMYAQSGAQLHTGDNLANMHISPTSCDVGNHDCTYILTGMGNNSATAGPLTPNGVPNTYYIWEHQTQSGGGRTEIATGDNISGGGPANKFDDVLTSDLDTYRFFTISTSSDYDSSKQLPVMIQEGGKTILYEHIYSYSGLKYILYDRTVFINGSAQLP